MDSFPEGIEARDDLSSDQALQEEIIRITSPKKPAIISPSYDTCRIEIGNEITEEKKEEANSLFFDDPPMKDEKHIPFEAPSKTTLDCHVSKSISCFTEQRKYIIEVKVEGQESKLILKTYQQCLHLHKLLSRLFGDVIPVFPYAIWFLHSEEEIANNLTEYFSKITADERILASFPMKLFLEQFNLQGKVCIVTGASSGIGKQTALMLAQLRCHVILACRSKEKTDRVVYLIQKETGNPNVEFMRLNLASLTSVNNFVSKFQEKKLALNYLVLNAGMASQMPLLTEDGFESIMGVNHIGHFALTNALQSVLFQGAPSRIVCVTSESHKLASGIPLNYSEMTKPISALEIFDVYNRSKLANCLFIKELTKRLPPQVTANLVNPGTVATGIWRDFPEVIQWGIKGILMDEEEGAFSTVQCIVDPNLEDTTNTYFDYDGRAIIRSPQANNDVLCKQLWSFTEECIKVAYTQTK